MRVLQAMPVRARTSSVMPKLCGRAFWKPRNFALLVTPVIRIWKLRSVCDSASVTIAVWVARSMSNWTVKSTLAGEISPGCCTSARAAAKSSRLVVVIMLDSPPLVARSVTCGTWTNVVSPTEPLMARHSVALPPKILAMAYPLRVSGHGYRPLEHLPLRVHPRSSETGDLAAIAVERTREPVDMSARLNGPQEQPNRRDVVRDHRLTTLTPELAQSALRGHALQMLIEKLPRAPCLGREAFGRGRDRSGRWCHGVRTP